jgi:hypothetical protein
MSIEVKITEQGPTPRLMMRQKNQVHRLAAMDLAVFWHDNFARKHFTQAGATEYGYAPRKGQPGNPHPKGFTKSYTGRKLKTQGHTRPLVYSGDSYLRVLASRNNVTATATKGAATAKLRLSAPTLNFRNPRSRIDMRAELTTVSPSEANTLGLQAGTYLQARYRALQETETTS